mgnify:CR=1 FL=1
MLLVHYRTIGISIDEGTMGLSLLYLKIIQQVVESREGASSGHEGVCIYVCPPCDFVTSTNNAENKKITNKMLCLVKRSSENQATEVN